jgi:UDP-2-acetamido-3-amino-2,3-dideoxy-glucuronate N-acetyltransferase
MLATVNDLAPAALQVFRDERGVLVPIEFGKSIPFPVSRFFWISDVPAARARGGHAHKACNQYCVCAVGSVRVEAFDGNSERTIGLAVGQALYVPPAIFTTEWFVEDGTVLMVFCDRPYERDDYLVDRDKLAAYRRSISA